MSSFLGFLKRLWLPLADRLSTGRHYKIIFKADIAQMAEQLPCKQKVGSSMLSVGTKFIMWVIHYTLYDIRLLEKWI